VENALKGLEAISKPHLTLDGCVVPFFERDALDGKLGIYDLPSNAI
jgi:hypothetical protein